VSVTVVERDPWTRRLAAAIGHGQWGRDDHGRLRRGDWIATYSGQKVWPLDPRADEIHYDDVCIGLAREGRYGNQSREVYSVGTHSVIVSQFVEQFARERGWSEDDALMAAREGLMHDASEAYIGDVTRPLKRQHVMRGYRRVEDRWWRAVCERFEIHPTPESTMLVKEVDTRIMIDEIDALMLDPHMEFSVRFSGVEQLGAEIPSLTWQQSAHVFSQRFNELFPDWIKEAA